MIVRIMSVKFLPYSLVFSFRFLFCKLLILNITWLVEADKIFMLNFPQKID